MRGYWGYQGLFPYDYQTNSEHNLFCTFPWKNFNNEVFTVNHIGAIFDELGLTMSGIIGTGIAASHIAPGVWIGSLSTIDPQGGYWIKLTSPFNDAQSLNNYLYQDLASVSLNQRFANLDQGKSTYTQFYMEQPASYEQSIAQNVQIGFGEDWGTNKTVAEGFKWGLPSNDASSPQFHAGNSPVDSMIGTNESAIRVWSDSEGGYWSWQGSLTLRAGNGYWMKFNRPLAAGEGSNFWISSGDNASLITGAYAGVPDYDGGVSRTIGTTVMSGSMIKGYNTNSAFYNYSWATNKRVSLWVNPMSTFDMGFGNPLAIGGSQDGNWNQILDPEGNDITNLSEGTQNVITAAKRHMHGIGTVGPDSTTTNGLPVSNPGNWTNGTSTGVTGGYTTTSGEETDGENLVYRIVTSGNNPTMTIESGGQGKNWKLGQTIRVTDPAGSNNTADFVISGMAHDPNYQFYNSCVPGRFGSAWPGYGNTNRIFEGTDGQNKTSWVLEFGFEQSDMGYSTYEHTHPGVMTGQDAMVDNPNGATDESGLQFRFWYEPHNKFYMLRLYTNGGVPITDANMTVKKFFNDYCFRSPATLVWPIYCLNQGYYFKMENFTDNPGAGWNE